MFAAPTARTACTAGGGQGLWAAGSWSLAAVESALVAPHMAQAMTLPAANALGTSARCQLLSIDRLRPGLRAQALLLQGPPPQGAGSGAHAEVREHG
mmetsp:Transcript_49687/g.139076  ORF Transcript_49687/g.139076 Transcript_49687/m.139076 type:complete len:97 (+) Transcript_49687:50-340(+)